MSGFSGNYLDALAHPTVVDPAAAIQEGSRAAQTIWANREAQAQNAWGQALQQSTGPDGTVDYAKANALAAGNPTAQLGMMAGLKGAALLTGAQQEQGAKRNSMLVDAISSALDPSIGDDQLPGVVQQNVGKLVASGAVSQTDAYKYLHNLSPNPAQMRQQLEQARVSLLPPQQKQEVLYGTPGSQTGPGGETVGTSQNPRGGRVTPSQPSGTGVPLGMSAADLDRPYNYTDADGKPQVTTWREILTKQGIPIPTIGGGAGGTGGAGAAKPPVPSAIPGGGVYRPSAPPSGGAPAPAAAPPGATPPPGSAPPPAPTPAPAGPVSMPVGPAPGKVPQLEADQKQFAGDQTALPQRQTQDQNLNHAYEALKLITTGGTAAEKISGIRSFLSGIGALPAGQVSDQAAYEIFRKYTERTIADAGNAGGTDLSRKVAEASNAGVSLVNPANLAVIRNDIGKVRQQMAATMTAPDKGTGAGYGRHSADTASNTDYRGFNWDQYSPSEQAAIMKSVGKEGTKAHDALARAIGMGRTFWPPAKSAVPVVPQG